MNTMLFPEDVANVIQSFYLCNKGDEATTDLLLAVGAELLDISPDKRFSSMQTRMMRIIQTNSWLNFVTMRNCFLCLRQTDIKTKNGGKGGDYMRCGNIRIHVEIPVYADKNNCFCDDNHVSYSIPAIRKACETASNLPIIQYDEQGTEKVVGVAQSIKWNPHGFIEVDGQLLFGGTNETVELGKDDCVVSMELSTVGLG